MRAVELNGAAIEMNKTAFAWGRLAVVESGAVPKPPAWSATPDHAERMPHALPMLPPGEWEASEWASAAHRARRDNEHEVRGVPDAAATTATSRSCRSTTRACRARSTN